MAPKYRGNSEDWLDSDASRSSLGKKARNKKKPKARSVDLPWDDANALVAEVFPNQCRVRLDVGGKELLCSYRRAEVIGESKEGPQAKERSPVAVGDRVKVVEIEHSRGVIEGICARRNCISRPAPGRESGRHVLAANLDLVLVVVSTREPAFSPGLVDRFLVAAEVEKVPVAVVVTKVDLSGSVPSSWNIYRKLGYPVFEVSAKDKTGVDELSQCVKGKTVVFCGQSGVGKTSLLRVLLDNDQFGKIGKVNARTGKGRHTTTSAVLLEGPEASRWIDTPGVREFSLGTVSPRSLAGYFPEMRSLECAQSGCMHENEPGCCARDLERYSSYLRILDSILNPV